MGWRDWSYWLRGGIIGLIFGLIANIIGWIIELNNVSPVTKDLGYSIVNILILPIMIFLVRIFSFSGLPFGKLLSNIFVILILYFVLGAIIGLIYGKIKNGDGKK